jgi:predicted MFS family arabinose efflux permease
MVRWHPGKLAVALAGWSAFIDLYATQPLLTDMAADYGVSTAQASLTLTVTTTAVALVAPFIGMVADAIGRKRVIATAALILSVPTLGAALSDSFTQLLVWRFIQGLLMPAIFGVTLAYVGEEWDPAEVPAVTGLYVAGAVMGGFTGRLIPGLVAEVANWRWGFVVLAVLNAGSALVIARYMPRERRFTAVTSIAATLATLGRHLTNPQLLATCAVGFGILFAQVASFTYVDLYLAAAPFGLGPGTLGSIFAVYLLGAVVTPLASRSIVRVGHKGALAMSVLLSVGGLLATLAPSLAVIIAGLALSSLGVFLAQAVATSYISRATSGGRSSAVGLYLTCYYLGGSAGASGPALTWSIGGWPACVALVVIVQILTIAIALTTWRPRNAPMTVQS